MYISIVKKKINKGLRIPTIRLSSLVNTLPLNKYAEVNFSQFNRVSIKKNN